jgi:serine/threonine protein kinase
VLKALQKNILISDNGHACITDFGLTVSGVFTQSKSSAPLRGGVVRWLAPELLTFDNIVAKKAIEADVFAFGRFYLMVCLYDNCTPFTLE